MDDVNPNLIERYQLLYQKSPNSKVFAPLVEAYRKMGLLAEALEVGESGVRHNPHFPGGRIALARVLVDLNRLGDAAIHLAHAVQDSPENLLAQSLLADTLLRLKRPKEALQAYKMVLFLNPNHTKAIKAVKKLESLTADEFDDEAFTMRPLEQVIKAWELEAREDGSSAPSGDKIAEVNNTFLERIVALTDAFLVRNDIQKAREVLFEGERRLGRVAELEKRFVILAKRENQEPDEAAAKLSPVSSRESIVLDDKIAFLRRLLKQFDSPSSTDSSP